MLQVTAMVEVTTVSCAILCAAGKPIRDGHRHFAD